MLLSRHQNVEQNHEVETANRSLKSMAQFKYFRTTVKENKI
jgi:hypothetical protein